MNTAAELGLDGQAAVITGAGRGIGRATALALAEAGANPVLAARTVRELEQTASEVRGLGVECLVVQTDVTNEAACENLIAETIDCFGRIDILINNAGDGRFKPIWEMTTEEFDLNLNTNLRGTYFCARAAIRAMMVRKSGTIVNIASSSGKKPYPGQGAYCAAKAGVILLSKVMALELREYGIHVHVICPGGVDTRLAEEIHPNRGKVGWIQPEDVARAIVYLLSNPSNITVDELALRRFEADPL